jgi:hypothetical protein
MAYLPRVSKPAQDWTQHDLLAYNIHIHSQAQSIFFNGLSCSGGALPSLQPASPLYPFLTTPAETPKQNTTQLTFALFSFWRHIVNANIELDSQLHNFLQRLLENMGPPYSSANGIYPSPTLTLHTCGSIYQCCSELCVHSNPLITRTISLLITRERFVGLNYPCWEKDEQSKFDYETWRRRPVDTWPVDDAEAKLIANAIATYNFNNYEVPKLYHNRDEEYKPYPDPCFMVHDPIFLAGMAWKGTHPSFYKISIGSDLVKAVQAGKYPCTPTRIYRYTPVLPEELEGGMDKLGMSAMKPLANRRVIIGCLEAFKMFLKVKRFSTPGLGL